MSITNILKSAMLFIVGIVTLYLCPLQSSMPTLIENLDVTFHVGIILSIILTLNTKTLSLNKLVSNNPGTAIRLFFKI